MPSNTPEFSLTESAKDGLVGFLEDVTYEGLSQSYAAATDYPGFVASNEPVLNHLAPARAITRAACRRWARGGGPQNLPGFDGAWAGICTPYLDSIAENPGSGLISPPFTGGQCPIGYTVSSGNYTLRRIRCSDGAVLFSGAGVVRGRANVLGPIKAITAVQTQSSNCGAKEIILRVTNGNNTVLDVGVLAGPGSNTERFEIVGLAPTVTPSNGAPDTCGNPAPTYKPPKIPTGLPPLTPQPITIPGIGPVSVDVTFSPTGGLVINLPDIGVDVELPNPFEKPGAPSEPSVPDPGPPPGDVGQPGAPSTTGEGGEVEGEAPAGSVLVGVRVEVLTLPPNPSRYTEEVYRGAYYVYMGVPGLLDLDPAGSMVRLDQFIFAEQPNLTAWRVRANSRYIVRATPYYRSAE